MASVFDRRSTDATGEATPTSQRISVRLVQIGQLPGDVDLTNVRKLFRKRDAAIEIGHIEAAPSMSELPLPKEKGYFFSEEELFGCLRPFREGEVVIGVTSFRIAPAAMRKDPENEHFGIWPNSEVTLSGDHENAPAGVISVSRWRERYQERAYRSTNQYLAFMILACLGDIRFGGLTHPWCVGCVFDYNIDDESLVSSLKRACLCEICEKKIKAVDENLLNEFESILAKVGRPPFGAVLTYLQGHGIASLFLFSVVLALAVGVLQTFLPTEEGFLLAAGVCLTLAAAFAAVVLFSRWKPWGGLK